MNIDDLELYDRVEAEKLIQGSEFKDLTNVKAYGEYFKLRVKIDDISKKIKEEDNQEERKRLYKFLKINIRKINDLAEVIEKDNDKIRKQVESNNDSKIARGLNGNMSNFLGRFSKQV